MTNNPHAHAHAHAQRDLVGKVQSSAAEYVCIKIFHGVHALRRLRVVTNFSSHAVHAPGVHWPCIRLDARAHFLPQFR